MASRAQWRFGIFVVGLQMAIKLNQVKLKLNSIQYIYIYIIYAVTSMWSMGPPTLQTLHSPT